MTWANNASDMFMCKVSLHVLEREYKYYSISSCVCDAVLLSCVRVSVILLSLSTCVYVCDGRRRKRRRRTKRTHELIHQHVGVMVLVEENQEEEEEEVVVMVV
jgi:hypothetical protein